MRWLARVLLAVAATAGSIALVEAGWSFAQSAEVRLFDENFDRRYYLVGADSGSAFQNIGQFFVFQPDSKIRAAVYYDTRLGWVKEFEHEFQTNNFGLVQRQDIHAGRPSVLVLGDSFTEGVGAEPWFEQLAPSLLERDYQPVNGGLAGTGFRQWLLLHDHLRARNILIQKLVVVMISDDYGRVIRNFSTGMLRCLANYLDCAGGGDQDAFGMPPESQRQAFLERMRSRRVALNSMASVWRRLPATSRAYSQGLHLADVTRDWLVDRLRQQPGPANLMGDDLDASAITHFADLYGDNVIFVHLPSRYELRNGPDRAGRATIAAIRATGAKYFDGFTRCGLTAADYHVYDGHPNAAGYAKITACVREAAKQIL